MIAPNAVAVVDLDGDALTPPFGKAANVTTVLQYAGFEQPPFDRRASIRDGHDFFDRPLPGPRLQFSVFDGFCPRGRAKAESSTALAVRVSVIIKLLNTFQSYWVLPCKPAFRKASFASRKRPARDALAQVVGCSLKSLRHSSAMSPES